MYLSKNDITVCSVHSVYDGQMETSGGSESSGGEDAEARRSRRGHVLAELMQTERVYVQELGSILSVST